MSLTSSSQPSVVDTAAFCLFKDVHKGIRNELFGLTLALGQTDPGDAVACVGIADRVGATYVMLEGHAEHEDGIIGPVLEKHLPDLADHMESDHVYLDRLLLGISEMSQEMVDKDAPVRRQYLHRLYLDTAEFVSKYLPHQNMEERVLMPKLEQAIGFDETLALHQRIVGSVPPQEMAQMLTLMLPAMNIEDRFEMIAPMMTDAPTEVLQGVLGLAKSILPEAQYNQLMGRLNLSQ